MVAGQGILSEYNEEISALDSADGQTGNEVFLEEGIGAVSYTHLDVYKRQVQMPLIRLSKKLIVSIEGFLSWEDQS